MCLDTDIVNSILAQAEKGLFISASAEKGVSKSDGETFGSEVNTDGKISGSLLKLVSLLMGRRRRGEDGHPGQDGDGNTRAPIPVPECHAVHHPAVRTQAGLCEAEDRREQVWRRVRDLRWR